jgi:replicative DNA helicase
MVLHRSRAVVHSRTLYLGSRIPSLLLSLPTVHCVQSWGTVVQAFDDTRPRQLRAAPASSSASRVPPHNLEAEESLLGAMLLSNDAASVAIEKCSAGDFYKPAHGHIFGAIRALIERGEPIDAVTVTDELQRSGLLEAVGDPSVFISLQANTPSIANARHYAAIVEEHSLLRRLIGVAGEIADLAYSVPEDVETAVDEAEQMMFNVAERRTADTMSPLHELLLKGLDRIEELGKRGSAITGVATGYHELDKILLGLQPSTLTIVGARPGMGKTSFALGILAHVGVVVQRPALLFSLEMGHLELTQRMLASEAEVNGQNLQTGQIRTQDWPKLGTAVTRLSNAPIFIDDNPNVTVMDIRARARRLKKSEGDLGLVVIDYLQLMTGRGRAENRQTEVAEISRGLKILARELEVPVVALSQLSRNLESRQDKTPMLSDLRESGSLEQDADVVLFLYRESEYNDEVAIDRADDALVDVAKHRNGPTGKANLLFLKQYARFENGRSM